MKNTILILFFLSFLYTGCQYSLSGQYAYQPPEPMGDGLEVGTLADVNLDTTLIYTAVDRLLTGDLPGVHSMLIYKDGKLVLEEYFEGHKYQWDAPNHHGERVQWDAGMDHHLMSATKSITSACIGIAIDKGFIDHVQQSIFDYLPDHQHLKAGGKEQITIEDLLTMRAGLEWPEWSELYSSFDNPAIGIWVSDQEPIEFILGKPIEHEPGTHFTYSSGNMMVLGEIIRHSSGMTIDSFANVYLAEPLDGAIGWPLQFDNGVYANNAVTTPRTMAKVGILFLQNGIWKGERLIAESWVQKSATTHPGNEGINVPGEDSGRIGYAYTWWTKDYSRRGQDLHMYTASGWGGQHYMVLPEANTVVVFTGENYLSKRPPFEIMRKYVVPALRKAIY